MSEKINEYVPQDLKDEILRIINPKFADCTRKKFEFIETSENKEEARKKVMFLIRKLIEKKFLTVNGAIIAKKDLSLYPKSKIEKAINYAFSYSPLYLYLSKNSKDKLRYANRNSKFSYRRGIAKILFGEKKQEGITLTNTILGHLKTNTELMNKFPFNY